MKIRKFTSTINESQFNKKENLIDLFQEWIDYDVNRNSLDSGYTRCNADGSSYRTNDLHDCYWIHFKGSQSISGQIKFDDYFYTRLIDLINLKRDLLDDYNLYFNASNVLSLISKKETYTIEQVELINLAVDGIDPTGNISTQIKNGFSLFYNSVDKAKLMLDNIKIRKMIRDNFNVTLEDSQYLHIVLK